MAHQDSAMPPEDHEPGSDAAGEAGTAFACTSCGAVAGVVRLVPAGAAVDMGSPIGEQRFDRDGAMIDRWIGGRNWQALDPDRRARAGEILAQPHPDPGALHAIHWELAPFWCRGCRRPYCRDHWMSTVIMDDGFYDYTAGICPSGHHQILDD